MTAGEAAPAAAPSVLTSGPSGVSDHSLKKTSAASFERLITSKQKEVDMLAQQNEQLRTSLDRLERELGDLANALAAKDSLLRAAQRKIDDTEHEVRQLGVVQSQSDGKDEAMKIAAAQNRNILMILQEANLKCKNLEKENGDLKAELQRCSFFSEKRMQRSVAQNERLRTALKFAQKEITVNMLAKMSCTTRAVKAEAKATEAEAKAEAEIAVHRHELNSRRTTQYLLTSALQAKSDEVVVARDALEAAREDNENEAERADELEARLSAAVTDLDETEHDLNETRGRAQEQEARAEDAEETGRLERLQAEALAAALEHTIDERRNVRAKTARLEDRAVAANAATKAAEAAAKRSLRRHVDTLTLVGNQKKEVRRLEKHLERANTLLRRKGEAVGRLILSPETHARAKATASVGGKRSEAVVVTRTPKKRAPKPRRGAT